MPVFARNRSKQAALSITLAISLSILTMLLVIAAVFLWGSKKEAGKDAAAGRFGHSRVTRLGQPNSSLIFIENRGQWHDRAQFVARTGGLTAWFEQDAITLQLEKQAAADQRNGVVTRLTFAGASEGVRLQGENPQPATRNYFIGNDRSKWQNNVPGYGQILYRGIYEGIDLRVREASGLLEYDLLLQPGADLGQVVIRCDGTEGLEIERDGSLLIKTALGPIRQKLPMQWP